MTNDNNNEKQGQMYIIIHFFWWLTATGEITTALMHVGTPMYSSWLKWPVQKRYTWIHHIWIFIVNFTHVMFYSNWFFRQFFLHNCIPLMFFSSKHFVIHLIFCIDFKCKINAQWFASGRVYILCKMHLFSYLQYNWI